MKRLILAALLSGCTTAPTRTFTERRTVVSAGNERVMQGRLDTCLRANQGRFLQQHECRTELYHACLAVGLAGNCAETAQ